MNLTPALLIATRPAQTLLWIVGLGLACQLLPGLERLRWMPADPTQLVPRFLRFEPDLLPWEAPAGAGVAEAALDDRALLALVDETPAGSPAPVPTPPPTRVAAVSPSSSGPGVSPPGPPSGKPIPLRGTYTLDTPLPPPPEPRDLGNNVALLPIEDPHGVMAPFYAALARTAAGDGKTRVVHYGDSLVTGDYITQTVRRLMQKKFGDGGHGFVLGGKTSPWYRRNNLDLETSEEWHANRPTRPQLGDGAYGLGAVSFRTTKAGEWVEYVPRDQNGEREPTETGEPLNQKIGQVDVFVWGGPSAGSLELRVDGSPVGRVDARRPMAGPVYAHFDLPDARHRIRLTTVGNGEVRLFGAALERDTAGVVYDSLGVDGTRAKVLRFFDPPHWYQQIRARAPRLLVLHYGTNEGEAADLGSKNYREDLLPIVHGLRAGLPDIPCLLVGPMDRADTNESGELVSRPVVPRIAEVQRRVAYMEGCAFWDAYRAMGGEGSMARWYRNHLGGGDMTHPTRQGAEKLGVMLFAALMDGYKRAER